MVKHLPYNLKSRGVDLTKGRLLKREEVEKGRVLRALGDYT